MKFYAVILMTTLVCFIHASKLNELCSSHKECGQYDMGCFESKCQWTQNYFSDGSELSKSYYAKELGDPCITDEHCSRVPTDADHAIFCSSVTCASTLKRG